MSTTDDRVVLVTGSSRGIGLAIARRFAEEGARVILHGRGHGEQLEQARDELLAQGREVLAIPFDLRDPAAVEAGVREAERGAGRIDVLVNNAGRVADAPFALLDEAAWREVLDVNLDGAFRVARAVVRPMLAARSGCIVNVGSVVGLVGAPGQANYAAAKAGLVGLSRALARELAPRNIRVNCVVPGVIDVGMTRRLGRAGLDRLLERVPLGRAGEPGEVADAVHFLASNRARYIVGQTLVVDGGLVT